MWIVLLQVRSSGKSVVEILRRNSTLVKVVRGSKKSGSTNSDTNSSQKLSASSTDASNSSDGKRSSQKADDDDNLDSDTDSSDDEGPSGTASGILCVNQLARFYEEDYGGFSRAPKFPQPSNLNLLFTFYLLHPDAAEAKLGRKMALNTLTMMARGGIHDHVSQGFARYSTDGSWHVPHFEKMLYDQVCSFFQAWIKQITI